MHILLGLIALLYISSQIGFGTVIFMLVALVIGIILYAFYQIDSEEKEEKRNLKLRNNIYETKKRNIKKGAERYKKHLAIKRQQLLTKDDYGDISDKKWRNEVKRFSIDKLGVRYNSSKNSSKAIDYLSEATVFNIIDNIAKDSEIDIAPKISYNKDMDGYQYEHYCATLLELSGWIATVSKGSGDQGVDIIAVKHGEKVAIQCKKYSSPVGNKAVQEIVSGMIFYSADKAVVVTNNSYTASAKQLAQSTDVILLHHSDLASRT